MPSRIASVAILAVLLATSCTRSSTANPKVTPALPTPSALAWADCGGGFQCGAITVPLDYSKPAGDTISIALTRKPATDSAHRIGSLLTNPGGPGASGIDYLRQAASGMTGLNARFDLVGFDPRGIGKSAPVTCLSNAQEDLFNALDPVLDDPQEKQATINADMSFAAGCQAMSAKVLPFVDTPNAARDMDLIRAALGDTKLTYLGFSYGTFLGLWYAHLFPTHVRALSLDGVVDPNLSANDLLLAQLVGFESNLQAYLAGCRSRSTCTFAGSGDPGATLTALIQSLDTNPLQIGSRQLTRALGILGVLTPLYDESEWTYLDLGLTAAEKGDGRLLLAFADIYLGRAADGSYNHQNDANYAVNCLDRPAPSDIASYDALGPAYAQASPFFGPATQYSNLPCAYWPAKSTRKVGPLLADGAPTILLVGGTNDPATPYAWAKAVSQQLANSVLLTRKGNGHVSYSKSACAQQAEDAYLIDLTLPAAGTICTG